MCSDKRGGSIGVIIVAYKNFFMPQAARLPLYLRLGKLRWSRSLLRTQMNTSQCRCRRTPHSLEDSSLVCDTASSSYLRGPLPLPFPRRRGIAADPSAVIAGGSRYTDARCVQSQEACHTKACAQSYHGRYLAGVVWAAQGGRAAFLLTRIVHHIRITLTGG